MKANGQIHLALNNPERSSMVIIHAVREAENAREVHFLLSAYLDAVRLGGEMTDPFRGIATAPLVSVEEVKERTLQLFFMLQAVSESLDDNSRVAVKEALYVFGAALDRIKSLERGTGRGREEQE
jgi:antitoxin (DNA-binding transcriptional repressor) of toxin-antitoxin stability system